MSGSFHPRIGEKSQHITAARDWLSRAEKQFAAGEHVLAAATLMLAQAELRLLVESLSETAAKPVVQPVPVKKAFRLVPGTRVLTQAATLAACLLIGLAVGRMTAPAAVPVTTPTSPVQIAQAPPPELPAEMSSPAPEPAQPPASGEEITVEEGPTAILGAEAPSPPSAAPRHRRSYRHPEVAAPPIPVAETPPQPAIETPPAAEPALEEKPSLIVIHPAEVALETIRALSERLLEGNEQE